MGRVLTFAAALALLVAAPAWADETIRAVTPDRFASPTTTIDQGEKVTLQNLDIAGHDVTSKQSGLFASALIDPGKSGPVRGTEYLKTGTYPFVCSIHPGMEATLKVTSAGTPVPRAELTVAILSSDLQRVTKSGKLMLKIGSSEAGTVSFSAKTGKKKLGKGSAKVDGSGAKKVALRLSDSGRKALRAMKKAKITVAASGGGGEASASRTLR